MSKSNQHHEEFVGKTGLANKVVRQERFSSQNLNFVYDGRTFPVVNYSLFGLAIKCETEFSEGHAFAEGKLFLGSTELGEYSLEVRRRETLGNEWIYGLETISGSIPVDHIQHMNELMASLSNIYDRAHKTESLSATFKYEILEVSQKLQSFENVARSFEARSFPNRSDRDEAWALVIQTLGDQMFKELRDLNLRLQKLMTDQTADKLKIGFQFFRDILGHFIFQSPFTKRSYEKPRGYAGDFEMMNQIYREDNHADSLFGSCMERAIHNHEEPTAVRNRSQYLAKKIIDKVRTTKGDVNILAVACGPAEEVKLALTELSVEDCSRVKFWLLDQDEEALRFAQKNIRVSAFNEGKKIKVHLLNQGIKQIILEGLKDKHFNLIYSAGLFDYFSDPVARRAGRSLGNAMAPNGNLIIGNFNITSPNAFGMLSLLDWSLILRGEADLARIYQYEDFALSVEAEPENVNLFLCAKAKIKWLKSCPIFKIKRKQKELIISKH